jgi:asparagine synthase (glutamine-hydrolysing)
MCGIAGVAGNVDTQGLRAMLDAQQHRGPDGRSIWQAQGAPYLMGHDRLAIIDVAGGRQPIPNEDESLWIVVNGEIYNHERLRAQLGRRHHFRTGSDSEVVLHLFEERGPEAFAELDGMFAAAICGQDGGLVLARDPLGIKPLYYGGNGDGALYFSSEIKSLVDRAGAVKEFAGGHYWQTGSAPVRYYSIPDPKPQIDRSSTITRVHPGPSRGRSA